MKRPAAAENTLERIAAWRRVVPDITIRSTFIVGFPGETEADFAELLEWLREAQLDRVGCFEYSPVEGAAANALRQPPVPAEVKARAARALHGARRRDQRAAARRKKSAATMRVLIDRDRRRRRHRAIEQRCAGNRRRGAHYAAPNELAVGDWAEVRITQGGRLRSRGAEAYECAPTV